MQDIPVQVASNPLQSHIGSDESPVEQQPASSQPGPSNTSRAQPLSSTHSATTSTAGPPPHSTSSFDVPQNVDRTHASSSSSSSRLPTLTSPSSSTQNPFTALYDSPYSLSPVANKAATKSTAARETTTSSMRPVLQLSQADNTAGPCSASLDPDIKPTIAASSTRLSSDSHPVAHWVDDDSDVEELTGSAIPTHMQKQTNRHNPIVLLDDEPGPSSLPAIAESATTQGGTSSLHGKLESRFDPTGAISRSLGGACPEIYTYLADRHRPPCGTSIPAATSQTGSALPLQSRNDYVEQGCESCEDRVSCAETCSILCVMMSLLKPVLVISVRWPTRYPLVCNPLSQ